MQGIDLHKIDNNDSGYITREKINNNFDNLSKEVDQKASISDLENASFKPKGYFTSEANLKTNFPNPNVGDSAWVGSPYPGFIYKCETKGVWIATTDIPETGSVDLDEYVEKTDVQQEVNTSENPVASNAVKYTLQKKANVTDLPLKYSGINVDIISGFYDPNTGIHRANSIYSCTKVKVSEVGRNITVTGTVDTPSIALAVYMDSANKYISNEFKGTSDTPVQYVKQPLVIPTNAETILITARNNKQQTTPIIGIYSYKVGDILTKDVGEENFVSNIDFLKSTETAPQKYTRVEVVKENGYIDPDGTLGGTSANYRRGTIEVTPENFNKLYYTGGMRGGGATIAAYLNEAGQVLKVESELQKDEYKFWRRYKLEMPQGTKFIHVCGQYDFSSIGGQIKDLEFIIEQFTGVDYEAITERSNSIVSLNRNNTKTVVAVPGSTINSYSRRWILNNFKAKTKRSFDIINIAVVRDYGASNFFTDGLKVSVITSTGYSKIIDVPFSEIQKYNHLGASDSLDKFIYSVYLNDYITLNEGDILQLRVYCKSENDKIAISVAYTKDELKATEFFDIITNGSYQQDGNTELSDNDFSNFLPIKVNSAWVNYWGLALSTINDVDKKELEKIYPSAIYTVANDLGKETLYANTRNYAALFQLDHCLNGLTSEPTGMCFDNGRTDIILMSPVSGKGGTDNAPIFNENQTILETTKNILIKGGEKYKDDSFNLIHRSTLASVSASKLPMILSCGDSTASSKPTTPYDLQNGSYYLHTKELFFKDWVDAGMPEGKHQALFLGVNDVYRVFYEGWRRVYREATYKGVTKNLYADKLAQPGENITMLLSNKIAYPDNPTSPSNIYLTKDGKFSIETMLLHHRTMDDNGVRLANDSPNKGLNVDKTDRQDLCVPNIILFGFGANDDPNSTSWLDNQKAIIASIKAEYIANNWGRVFIGIMQPSQAGTYFPSLHPNLPNELMFWDKTQYGATEGRHSRLWQFYQQWIADGTYTEAHDVYCLPFFFTAPVNVPMNRLMTLPDGTPIVAPSTGLPFTHVNAIAHQHWGYQLYSWIKYVMSLG